MPVHDWTRVDAGIFHHFHHSWTNALCVALNKGGLPPGYFALAEQVIRGPHPDVLNAYVRKANWVAVYHKLGDVIAVIEIVSPGNKDSNHAIRSFVRKATELLDQGVHLLIVDLFPPSDRDPQGIHKAIWDEIQVEPFTLPENKPLTLVSYLAADVKEAYVEPVGVGDELTAVPLFLSQDIYVPVPLEDTYQATWDDCPGPMKELLEPPRSSPN